MVRFSFNEVWDRVVLLTEWQRLLQMADFLGFSSASISGAKKRGFFPVEWAIKIAHGYKGSTDWLLTGEGPMHKGDKAAPTVHPQPAAPPPPAPAETVDQSPYTAFDALGAVEGMGMLTSIYSSGDTTYIRAINANLIAFSDAITMKKSNKDMQLEINTLNARITTLEQKLEKLLETRQQTDQAA
jgi:hypothetical protein